MSKIFRTFIIFLILLLAAASGMQSLTAQARRLAAKQSNIEIKQ